MVAIGNVLRVVSVMVVLLLFSSLARAQEDPVLVTKPFISKKFAGVSTIEAKRTAVGSSRSATCIVEFDSEGRMKIPRDQERDYWLPWDESSGQWVGEFEGVKLRVQGVWYGPVLQLVYDAIHGKEEVRIFMSVVETR